MIEIIEQRAFSRAIERAPNIDMLLDHDEDRILASTGKGTLKLQEDNVGLRAEATVTDEEVIEGAKKGKLRGWSFKMCHPKDEVEERAGKEYPIRRVSDFDMPEISLIMKKIPCYSSTSIEIRAGGEEDVELRSMDDAGEIICQDDRKQKVNIEYREKLEKLKAVSFN